MTNLRILAALSVVAASVALVGCDEDKSEEAPKASAIHFTEETLALQAGQTKTLELTVVPNGATVQAVLTTSDETVLKADGMDITAVNPGIATVTAKAGDLTAQCTVKVSPEGWTAAEETSNNAAGYYYGNYYMAGTDSFWIYLTTGNTVYNDGTFSGDGKALFMELNTTPSEKLQSGTFTVSKDTHEAGTFEQGDDFGVGGLWGTFIYDNGESLIVDGGTIIVDVEGDIYSISAYVSVADKQFTFSYNGKIPVENYAHNYDSYEVIEMKNLSHGTLDFYNHQTYGDTGTDYAGWSVYLADESVDLYEYTGDGQLLYIDLNTASDVRNALPDGTYKVMYSFDKAHFHPFTIVPGGDEIMYGSGCAINWEPVAKAQIGWAKIARSGETYNIDFKFRDDSAKKFFQGHYSGPLTYSDYSE